MSGSKIFQIVVNGKVDRVSINEIILVSVDHTSVSSGYISTLTGSFEDEAALNGIVNTLYNRRHTIISITKLNV